MAEDDFSSRLRMQSIYGGAPDTLGTSGQGPYGATNAFEHFAGVILPILRQREMERQNYGMQSPGTGMSDAALFHLKELAHTEPNVIYQPPLSDTYKGALLGLKGKEEARKQEETGIKETEEGRRQQETGIHQQRANVYAFKAKNPAHKIITPGDGRVYAVDPITNKKQDLGIDTLSNEDKINLTGQQRMEQIGARGEVGQKLEETRQTGRESLEEIKARHAQELAGFKAEQPSKSADLPSQQATARWSKAQEAVNTHPEWKDHITFDPSGKGFAIKPPGTSLFGYGPATGPDEKTYHAINEFIYGGAGKKEPTKSETKPGEKPKSKFEIISVKPAGKK